MKGIKTLEKSINVKDAPVGTTPDFAICVKQIDKNTLKTTVEGAADIITITAVLQHTIVTLLRDFDVQPLAMFDIISNIIADYMKEEGNNES